jgi:hypothetical protein
MRQKTLRAVPTPLDPEGADVITLKAPGKQRNTTHPVKRGLPEAYRWLAQVRSLMVDQGLSLAEADQIVTGGFDYSHDGKGRKFQPSGLR